MKVIKRNGSEEDFLLEKIENALNNANLTVPSDQQMDEEQMQKVIKTVMKKLDGYTTVSVEDINSFVESALVRHNKYQIAKNYILYRENKKKEKKFTQDEEKILALIGGNSELRGDNANKHIDDNGSIRDYIAGIKCQTIAEKMLPEDIVRAHKSGVIHWHDMDYSPLQPEHNCDLINQEDMLQHTFVMGDTLIEPNDETPFRTACNLSAQINLIVSGRQYGGQTVSWAHLLPFIANSRRLIRKEILADVEKYHGSISEEELASEVNEKLREEIKEGVKTYQYQILCHQSSNGQTPFVSNNLCLREAETQQELDDFAMLIEEIFNRRIKGVKDKNGHFTTPLFPKLLYWVSKGLNYDENDPYFYLTQLAAKCNAYRMQPDIVSEQETRKVKQGQIIPSMGCRSLLGPIWEETEYPITEKFYWVEGVGTYPYGTFVEKRTFESVPNGEYEGSYENGKYAINFRGNTGWLVKKTDDKVIIKKPIVYGRWNNGVVTINLPHVALEATTTNRDFYEVLDERLALCHKALKVRYARCQEIKAMNSPILWQYGALARLQPTQTVGELMEMHPRRATISLGYVGLYETCEALIGQSNTTDEGRKLSKDIMTYINKTCDQWKKEDNINYAIYGTPEESLTYKFALANRRDFGLIPKITDKDYVVNSYHVDPRETIDAFKKLEIEGEFLALSAGGAVSYVETGDLTHNLDVIVKSIQWMADHIIYAEINRVIGVCYECGHEGKMELVKTTDGRFKFICPNCGNSDDNKMNVKGRLCGYLGEINAGNTNKGRLDDVYNRKIHLDCYDECTVQPIMEQVYDLKMNE